MEARQIQKDAKILLTDLSAGKDEERGLTRFSGMLAAAFSSYGLIKLSMNYFTLCEMVQEERAEDQNEADADYRKVQSGIRSLLSDDPGKDIDNIRSFRDEITSRMKVLTAYTDFFELHEYILNRKEAGLFGQIQKVSPEELAEEAFQYVFSDGDKMVINTRIQSVVEQLPVRMTTQRFYDILSEAIAIYKGGEMQSARDFMESLRDAALLSVPEGYDSLYPDLKQSRELFDAVTYKDLGKEEYQALVRELEQVTKRIEALATKDLLLQEILNDILLVQLTAPIADPDHMDDKSRIAKAVLEQILTEDDITDPAEDFDRWFLELEGAQEAAYETLLLTEVNLESYADLLPEEDAKALRTADILVSSSSLFMDLDKVGVHVVEEKAEEAKIEEMKKVLFEDFDAAFSGLPREEKRSRMAKVLSMVPVFFNTRDEIKEYFLYALENCRDDSELTAVSHIIRSMIQG